MISSQWASIMQQRLGELRILLPGIPGVSSRGYFGYCTVVLFPLDDGWALFDTGHYSDRHLLIAALGEAGLTPDDINHVVLSHLHFDHSGGCTRLDRSGAAVTTFPNATYYVQRANWEEARNPSVRFRASSIRTAGRNPRTASSFAQARFRT